MRIVQGTVDGHPKVKLHIFDGLSLVRLHCCYGALKVFSTTNYWKRLSVDTAENEWKKNFKLSVDVDVVIVVNRYANLHKISGVS